MELFPSFRRSLAFVYHRLFETACHFNGLRLPHAGRAPPPEHVVHFFRQVVRRTRSSQGILSRAATRLPETVVEALLLCRPGNHRGLPDRMVEKACARTTISCLQRRMAMDDAYCVYYLFNEHGSIGRALASSVHQIRHQDPITASSSLAPPTRRFRTTYFYHPDETWARL